MEHTPTPWWYVGPKDDGEGHDCFYVVGANVTVAMTDSWRTEFDSRDAAFIVKACNNYEALVEALKALLSVATNYEAEIKAVRALEAAGEL